jgi:CheY-like chemotaxis protein
MGYAVESDTDVRAALARLERDPQAFDLVVSDQTMPILTGLEFAVRIHRLRADLPIILATGNRENLPAAGLRAAEVCEVVAKPYTADELAEVIQRHLPHR